MTATFSSTDVAGSLLGWLVTLALSLVGYLVWLQIKEHWRNQRLDAQRELLGLKRARRGQALALSLDASVGRIRTTGFLADSERRLQKAEVIHTTMVETMTQAWADPPITIPEVDSSFRLARASESFTQSGSWRRVPRCTVAQALRRAHRG